LEVISKPQIMFESPAIQRDFTPIHRNIKEFNKSQADEKVVVPRIRMVCEHFKEACDAPQCYRIDANPASRGNAAIAYYSGCQKFVPINCHCEEPGDEAIFLKRREIASLRSQ